MPIDQAQIPALIKAAETNTLEKWKKTYFEKVATNLQVHTKGHLFTKVNTLFPNEHPDSKAHCLATYEPITKGSIWKGINNLKRIFSHSSFTFQVGEQTLAWLNEYEWQGHNLLNYFKELWISKAVAEDPNGLFVLYPPDWAAEREMCPLQFVRSSLIKGMPDGNVAFVSEIDSKIKYSYEDTATYKEVYEDYTAPASQGGVSDTPRLNAKTCTQVTYNHRLKLKVIRETVHLVTRDGILIYTRLRGTDQYEWETVDFPDTLTAVPVFVAGGPVADEADQKLYESFVNGYIPFGNLALIQHRNHRAVDLQFSYPRLREIQTPCDYRGCASGKVKGENGLKDCPKCGGSGWVVAMSPYKVYTPRFNPGDNNDHLKEDPVKFYSPDVGIIDYSKNSWKDYLQMAEEAIYIQQRVETGNVESADSKKVDKEEAFAYYRSVGKTFYNSIRALLQSTEEYIELSPMAVSVEAPHSLAILTEGEAFTELTTILSSNAPNFIKANNVENFVSKFISRDSPVIRALEVLKSYDLMLFYSNAEVQGFKAGGAIKPEMVTKHVLAYPLLLKMYQDDKDLFETSSKEQIIAELDKQIKELAPPLPDEGFRTALQGILNESNAA